MGAGREVAGPDGRTRVGVDATNGCQPEPVGAARWEDCERRGVTTVERYLEAAYALLVAGAAMIYPPAALAVAAIFLIALAVVADRREVKS